MTAYVDLLVVDAFVGARIPGELTTDAFFADARRVLSDRGVLIVNATDRGPLAYARRVASGIFAAFPHIVLCAEPATIKGRRFGNVILAGGVGPLPYAEVADRAGRGPFPYRVLFGPRLQQLIAGVAPFTGDGEWSPPPPSGLPGFD